MSLKNSKLNNAVKKLYQITLKRWFVTDYLQYLARQKKVCWGLENKDKTFYVIRRIDKRCGIFAWVIVILGHLKIADDNGWIPVVDMKTRNNPFLTKSETGKVNAWEVFFKQPMSYTLEDISKSKNIILSYAYVPNVIPDMDIFKDKQLLDMWRKLTKKYIMFNEEMNVIIESMASRILPQEKVLGLLFRGTDYWQLKPKEHPVQPNMEQLIEKTHSVMKRLNMNKAYLCTEDETIIKAMKKVFGDKIIIYPRQYVNYKGGYLVYSTTNDCKSKKQLTVDYLGQLRYWLKPQH